MGFGLMGNTIEKNCRTDSGFTLIELLVAMTIGSLVAGTLYSVYASQQRIHVMHKQIVDIQQSLRTCSYLMEQEIKQACLDPLGSAKPSIFMADFHTFGFQYDRNGNGHDFTITDDQDPRAAKSGEDEHESICYRLSQDTDQDGMADSFPCKLYRCTWNTPDTMADNIESLNFVYRDESGTVLKPLPLDDSNRALIRTVEITLIARSERPDPTFLDTRNYTNIQGDTLINAPNDHYHRKSMSKIIRLRNL